MNINETNLFEFVIKNIDNIRIIKATSEISSGKFKINININNLAIKCHVIDTVSKKKVGFNYYDALKLCKGTDKDNFINSIKFYVFKDKEKNKLKELKEHIAKLDKKRSIDDSKESKSKKKTKNSTKKNSGSSSTKI